MRWAKWGAALAGVVGVVGGGGVATGCSTSETYDAFCTDPHPDPCVCIPGSMPPPISYTVNCQAKAACDGGTFTPGEWDGGTPTKEPTCAYDVGSVAPDASE
jgi:hypothetical protein